MREKTLSNEMSNRMAPTGNNLNLELKTILDRARHDSIVFAVTTIILTPVAVFALIFIILLAFVFITF